MSEPERTEPEDMGRAEQLFAAGDYPAATALLRNVVASGGATAKAHLLLARTLQRQGRPDDAAAAAEAGCEAFPQDRRLRTYLGRVLLKFDQPERAEQVFAKAAADFADDPRTFAFHADACLLGGKNQEALISITRACEIDPETAEYRARYVTVLCALGKLPAARTVARESDLGAEDLLPICQGVVTYANKHDRKVEALALAGNVCALMPDAAAAWITYAECLLEVGRGQDAVAALAKAANAPSGLPKDKAIDIERLRGRALRMANDDEGAIAAYQAVLDAQPNDEAALRELYILSQRAGRDADRRAYGKRLSATGAKALPSDLVTGLEALREQRPPPGPPNEKLKWAWEIAGRPESEYESWRQAVHWGHAADRLLRAWWLNAPDRHREIDALIDPPSPNPLDDLPKGARCVAITTHLGPMGGQVRFLETCGRPFRGFGFAGPDPVVDGRPPMRIAAQGNSPGALRELIHEIERGTLIGFAPDSPDPGGDFSTPFLGRTVVLSTFVPRLIFKYKTASLWWQALWRDGRIAITLERFPDPMSGERIEVWCRRWCMAYLEKMAPIMRGAPENLNLGHGVWPNASGEFAWRRKAAMAGPARQNFA